MARKLILFNGPPESGKDTAANYCYRMLPNSRLFKMSRPIKDAVEGMFALDRQEVAFFEQHENKDKPHPRFFGKTYREVQISFSEDWAKQVFGNDVFGNLAARLMSTSTAQYHISSDTGFDYEVEPLLKRVGRENTLLVQLFRPGKSFAKDSRDYITLDNVRTLRLTNDGSIMSLEQQLQHVIKAWAET